jgi:hypothetical protein
MTMPRKIFPPCLAVAGLLAVAAFFPGVLRADPTTSDPVADNRVTGNPVTVVVSKADCQRLARYIPDASASADYQPGVSATGKPVAPADINQGATITPPEVYNFTLNFSALPGRFTQSTINLGQVTVTREGRVFWNGQPLEDADSAALSRACQEILPAK